MEFHARKEDKTSTLQLANEAEDDTLKTRNIGFPTFNA